MAVLNAQVGIPSTGPGCSRPLGCGGSAAYCVDALGCPANACPDFTIKRHDTMPPFRVLIDDCNGAMNLTDTDLVLEASMWANARLKKKITAADTYFQLADNIGFEQLMVGDVILTGRVRLPERMLVTAFDETNRLVKVERGYGDTTPQDWPRGTRLRIFRTFGAPAQINYVLHDVVQEDGTVKKNHLAQTYLVYPWTAKDTCTPGCYWLEFKLLKMEAATVMPVVMTLTGTSITPSFTPPDQTPGDFGCGLGDGVEWVRRFPESGEGFLIRIVDSATGEW